FRWLAGADDSDGLGGIWCEGPPDEQEKRIVLGRSQEERVVRIQRREDASAMPLCLFRLLLGFFQGRGPRPSIAQDESVGGELMRQNLWRCCLKVRHASHLAKRGRPNAFE